MAIKQGKGKRDSGAGSRTGKRGVKKEGMKLKDLAPANARKIRAGDGTLSKSFYQWIKPS